MSILIVEDNPVTSTVLSVALRKHGYHPVAVSMVRDAVDYLQRFSDVSAAIVDLSLPEVDGFEAVDWIRTCSQYAYLPVLICSGRSDPETIRRLSKMQCKYYILKPFQEEELLDKVRAAIAEGPPLIETRAMLMGRLGITPAAYDDIVGMFIAALSSKLAHVDAALSSAEQGDANQAVPVDLQDIMETAGLFGAARLHDVIRQLPHDAESPAMLVTREQWLALRQEAMAVQQGLEQPAKSAA